MIELRWIERAHPPEHDGATGYVERVLQYRQTKFYLDIDGYPRSSRTRAGNIALTEWQDVPVVQETLAAEEG